MAEPNYPIVDYIVKQEGPGTYNVYFKDFDNADVDSIKAWLKDNIEYNDVKQAPILPADINNSSNAYHDVEHAPDAEHNNTWTTRELNDLKVVAFSGDYNDLDNAIEIPSELDAPNAYENGVLKPLNEIAFTGRVNLNSIEVSHVLDLTTYTISDNVNENSKLQYLGAEDTFIKGYGVGTAGQKLSTAISILVDNFQNNKRPCFIISNSGYFFVLSATAYMGGSDTPRYHKIVVSEVIDANYPFEVQADITDAQAEEKLNSITISSKQITFIFDLTNKIIYCKTKAETEIDISGATIQASQISGLSSIATSGNYEDLNNKPTLFSGNYNDLTNKPNLDASANNSSITGLARVAISGDYDDLDDTHYTFSPSAFIYRYDTTNSQNINMSQEDAELLAEVGFRKGYIKNIDQLYNDTTTYTTDTAFTSIIEDGLLAAFLDGKICYLQTRYDYYLITKIDHFKINNTLAFMSIICAPVVDNNYAEDQLFNESTSTDAEIETILNSLTCKMKVPCITLDFNKKILYSYYLEYIPE